MHIEHSGKIFQIIKEIICSSLLIRKGSSYGKTSNLTVEERRKKKTDFIKNFEKENYKKVMVRLRYDIDKELIDYIEEQKSQGIGTTELVRDALWKHYLGK